MRPHIALAGGMYDLDERGGGGGGGGGRGGGRRGGSGGSGGGGGDTEDEEHGRQQAWEGEGVWWKGGEWSDYARAEMAQGANSRIREPVFSVYAMEARKRGGPGGGGAGDWGGGSSSDAKENENEKAIMLQLTSSHGGGTRGNLPPRTHLPPHTKTKTYCPSPVPDYAAVERSAVGEAIQGGGGGSVVAGGGGDGWGGVGGDYGSAIPMTSVRVSQQYRENTLPAWGGGKFGGKGAPLARVPLRDIQNGLLGGWGQEGNLQYQRGRAWSSPNVTVEGFVSTRLMQLSEASKGCLNLREGPKGVHFAVL